MTENFPIKNGQVVISGVPITISQPHNPGAPIPRKDAWVRENREMVKFIAALMNQ